MARIHGDVGRMKKVIDEYSGYLPSNVYESNLMFANGLYYYTQNDYINSARAFLRAEAKDDMLFNCLIRVWHLRSSYEADSNDIDLLFNRLVSFEKFIYRNSKLLKHRAKDFELFIFYSMNLLKYDSKQQFAEGLKTLQSEQKFAAKDWLIQKYSARIKK